MIHSMNALNYSSQAESIVCMGFDLTFWFGQYNYLLKLSKEVL